MPWFRMYDSVLDDPKVQLLSPETFRGWVNVLCLAKRNGGTMPPMRDTAFMLRISEPEATALINTLLGAGLLDDADGTISPHNWRGRQYESDTSTERVKRFRKRFSNVSHDVSETPPETETETDPETDRINDPMYPPRGRAKSVASSAARGSETERAGSVGVQVGTLLADVLAFEKHPGRARRVWERHIAALFTRPNGISFLRDRLDEARRANGTLANPGAWLNARVKEFLEDQA
jgi:hypothetical protein